MDISVISWRSVILVDKEGMHGANPFGWNYKPYQMTCKSSNTTCSLVIGYIDYYWSNYKHHFRKGYSEHYLRGYTYITGEAKKSITGEITGAFWERLQ